MAEAYIVSAGRTAGGRRGGKLKDWHPADLAGKVLDAVVARAGIDGAAVDGMQKAIGAAKEQGGTVLTGGERVSDGVPAGGHYVRPAIVAMSPGALGELCRNRAMISSLASGSAYAAFFSYAEP